MMANKTHLYGVFGKVPLNIRVTNKLPKDVEKQMDNNNPQKTWKAVETSGVTEHAAPQPTYDKLIPIPERVEIEIDQPKKETE